MSFLSLGALKKKKWRRNKIVKTTKKKIFCGKKAIIFKFTKMSLSANEVL